ncbi:hypothetical protein J4408_02215 [Candidatus Pacearchaeota archaeon]|nr:hypothetical protein [Candidatus Pacearchaeota archaeon]
MAKNRYMIAEDFMKGAMPSKTVKELYDELAEESRNQIIDPAKLRRMRDYSNVANQVVGAEVSLDDRKYLI